MYSSIATSIPTGIFAGDTLPLKMHCCPSDGGWGWAASKRFGRGCNSWNEIMFSGLHEDLCYIVA